MTVRQTAEVTVNDLSDAYSVTLTNEAASFKATSDTKLGTAATATTKPQAFRGTEAVACSVAQADCVCSDSTNVSVSVNSTGDNATWPLITITIGANATSSGTVTIPCVIGTGANAVTINKVFSYSIALKGTTGSGGAAAYNYFLTVSPDAVVKAEDGTLSPSSVTLSATRLQGTGSPSAYSGRFKVEKYVNGAWDSTAVYTSSANESSKSVNVPTDSGLTLLRCSLYLAGGTSTLLEQRTVPIVADGPTGATGRSISSTAVTYQKGTSATTAPTGTWSNSPVATATGEYLWTKTVITYSSGDPTTLYTVSAHGATGTAGGRWYSGTGITGTSTTATVFSGSGISSAVVGDMYLNTDTYNTYRCTVAGNASTAKWVYVNNVKGAKGDTGAGGISMSITSSAGTTFRNNSGSTTLTAHVYQDGVELTGTALSALGTVTWYKDGTATGTTGATQTVSAADVADHAVYTAKLEG